MAATDSQKKQWTDPKDYGLPYVEISKLGEKTLPSQKSKPEEKPLLVSEPVVEVSIPEVGLEAPTAPEVSKVEPIIADKAAQAERPTQAASLSKEKPKQKTPAWVWSVAILALAIFAVIIWQLQSIGTPSDSTSQPPLTENKPAEEARPVPSQTQESTPTEQNQPAVNQDSIATISNSNPNLSKPAETGTTIANVAVGNLIRIESKTERPQYFIIVGSLPNEKLAIEEASQYFARVKEIYLISPEEGSKNYRLALSSFGSFRLAAEELERIKSQYTEELWILKY